MLARYDLIRQRLEATNGNEKDPYVVSMRALPDDLSTLRGSLQDIFISPIKSLGMMSLKKAALTPQGLQTHAEGIHDRAMMLAVPSKTGKAQFQRFSQRDESRLATIKQVVDKYGRLRLHSDDGPYPTILWPQEQHAQSTNTVTVEPVPGKVIDAEIFDGAVVAYIRHCLRGFRDDVDQIVLLRSVKPETSEIDVPDMFCTDGGQMLLTNEQSLHFLNEQLAAEGKEPSKLSSFRPNLHLTGLPPHIEDIASGFAIDGDIRIACEQLCFRCAVTMIDQETAQKRSDKEPLQSLRQFRPVRPNGSSKTPTFGVNAKSQLPPDLVGILRTGAPVRILGEKEV